MIKLFSVKVQVARVLVTAAAAYLAWHQPSTSAILGLQDKQKQAAAQAATGKPKQSAGELRLQKGTASCVAACGSSATAAASANSIVVMHVAWVVP
jgi:hypothetical protein